MKMREILHEQHQGTVSFEFIIVLCLFAVLMFTIVSVPMIDYDTPGAGGFSGDRLSFVEFIVAKVGELRDYITNNGDNTGVWFN